MNPIRSAIAIILLTATAEALAAEEVSIRDGGSAPITLSARELTRIGISGDGKLGRILAPEGLLEVRPGTDAGGKDTGDAFVRPLDPTPDKMFSFFVRDDRGATYTLVATVADVPSHTVLLHPSDPVPIRKTASDKAEPYVRRIKALIRAMAQGDPDGNFQRESVGRTVPIWRQTEAVLDQKWTSGSDLKGERWSFRNASTKELRLDESQFTGLYADTRAIAIERQVLQPGESTRVFIVRGTAP